MSNNIVYSQIDKVIKHTNTIMCTSKVQMLKKIIWHVFYIHQTWIVVPFFLFNQHKNGKVMGWSLQN
jgi:hypothetical protein